MTRLIVLAMALNLVASLVGFAGAWAWFLRLPQPHIDAAQFAVIYRNGLIGSVADWFNLIARTLLFAVLAIWIEMLSRWAAALKAHRLARTLRLVGDST